MCVCLYVYVCMYVWVGGWERTCMYVHIIMCVIVYPSSYDDIDIRI